MKTSKVEIARLDIEVLTDFQNDVRENAQALDNQAFYMGSSWNLRGHLNKTIGSLQLLHDALDLEIENRKLDLDYELVFQMIQK
jgi:hypothetical protein